MNKTFESIRARFLTISRTALALPERRCGPELGEEARRVIKRREGRNAAEARRSSMPRGESQLVVIPALPRREPAS